MSCYCLHSSWYRSEWSSSSILVLLVIFLNHHPWSSPHSDLKKKSIFLCEFDALPIQCHMAAVKRGNKELQEKGSLQEHAYNMHYDHLRHTIPCPLVVHPFKMVLLQVIDSLLQSSPCTAMLPHTVPHEIGLLHPLNSVKWVSFGQSQWRNYWHIDRICSSKCSTQPCKNIGQRLFVLKWLLRAYFKQMKCIWLIAKGQKMLMLAVLYSFCLIYRGEDDHPWTPGMMSPS